jgi:hypothetical protein
MRGRIISLFAIFFYFLSSASKILEYRFGMNFGQVFYDYSGNGRHALNGRLSSVDGDDGTSTDRGIYFYNTQITLPSNTIVPAMAPLAPIFSIVTWAMILNGGELEFLNLYNGQNVFFVTKIFGSPLYYEFEEKNPSNTSTLNFGSGNIQNNKWQLVISTFVHTILTVYINGALLFTTDLGFEYQTQTYTSFYIWGYSNIFMWNYLLLDTETTPSDYFVSSSSVCLLAGGCQATCSPGIIDSNLGTGCLSIVSSRNTYSSGVSCSSSCSKSCSSTVC